jgi:hypothetical protein
MNVIVEMKFGSHLYGTNSPQSDIDVKGIYLPSLREILLGRFPKTIDCSIKTSTGAKNTVGDLDREFYSLHYFIDLASKGETVALDMLHAPESALITSNRSITGKILWETLQANRHLFYTKNLKALVGYARRQAAKYGVKGSRLAAAKSVLFQLQESCAADPARAPFLTIEEIYHRLPITDHSGPVMKDGVEFYQVCGKYLTLAATAMHYMPMLKKYIAEYGGRAQLAEQNEGIDWKAVSHALRAGYQVRSILKHGDFTYPLPETEYLKSVKSGSLSFKDDVGQTLEALMDEIEELNRQSSLPDEVDRSKIDELLLKLLYEAYEDIGGY